MWATSWIFHLHGRTEADEKSEKLLIKGCATETVCVPQQDAQLKHINVLIVDGSYH
jgi:hypothetical protein